MYTEYWKLKEKPFRNTPDPKYLYHSKEHEEALVRLLYVITEGKGAMLLTGDYGCGKTLISHVFLSELNDVRYDLAMVTHPNLSSSDFLKEILYQLDIESGDMGKSDMLHVLGDYVYENHRNKRDTIVIVDEAQLVTDAATLEEIRLLLNFQQNEKFYITLILMGQPELREIVEQTPQLKQRLSVRYHLAPLSKTDTKHYIRHRLTVAGGDPSVFTEDALECVHSVARGVPRDINNVCDMALLMGFAKKVEAIDEPIIVAVIDDMSR